MTQSHGQRRSARNIRVAELVRNPANIRDTVGDVTELARSIKARGILNPLIVTEDPAHRGWLLLAGHRRFAAARQAELLAVPCFIHHDVGADPVEQTVVMLIENVQRKNLSPVEKARAYGRLRDQGLTPTQIASRTGLAVSSIHTHLSLLDLDDNAIQAVEDGTLTAGAAIDAVREARQQQRRAEGRPDRGRPVVAEPRHLTHEHPLGAHVARICDHSTRPKLPGSDGCGECWEAVIRAHASGAPMPPPTYDELLVERIVEGTWTSKPQTSASDRVEVVRRWTTAGKSLDELAVITGWKVQRYVLPEGATA